MDQLAARDDDVLVFGPFRDHEKAVVGYLHPVFGEDVDVGVRLFQVFFDLGQEQAMEKEEVRKIFPTYEKKKSESEVG